MRGPLFIILSIIGLILSVVLVFHDVGAIYGVATGPSLCSFGGLFDCDKVAASPYSRVYDIPVASFALLYYLVLTAYLVYGVGKNSAATTPIVFVATSISLLATIAMFSISLFVIGSFCLYCSGLYVVNTLLFLLAFSHVREQGVGASFASGVLYLASFFTFGLLRAKDFRASWIGLMLVVTAAMFVYRTPQFVLNYYYRSEVVPSMSEEQMKKVVEDWKAGPKQEIAINVSDQLQHTDFTLGTVGAPVTIVEFSDFECPHCRKASGEIKSAVEAEKGNVLFVFKNFPLDPSCNTSMPRQLHPSACLAASYARCAGLKGVEYFWAMHDAIFSLQALDGQVLAKLPAEMGLDEKEFADCVKSPQVTTRLQADIEQGVALQIPGTPAIYINGRQSPSISRDALLAIIRHELGK